MAEMCVYIQSNVLYSVNVFIWLYLLWRGSNLPKGSADFDLLFVFVGELFQYLFSGIPFRAFDKFNIPQGSINLDFVEFLFRSLATILCLASSDAFHIRTSAKGMHIVVNDCGSYTILKVNFLSYSLGAEFSCMLGHHIKFTNEENWH